MKQIYTIVSRKIALNRKIWCFIDKFTELWCLAVFFYKLHINIFPLDLSLLWHSNIFVDREGGLLLKRKTRAMPCFYFCIFCLESTYSTYFFAHILISNRIRFHQLLVAVVLLHFYFNVIFCFFFLFQLLFGSNVKQR